MSRLNGKAKRLHTSGEGRGGPDLLESQLGVLMQRPSQGDHALRQVAYVLAEVGDYRQFLLSYGRLPRVTQSPDPPAPAPTAGS